MLRTSDKGEMIMPWTWIRNDGGELDFVLVWYRDQKLVTDTEVGSAEQSPPSTDR